MIRPSKILSGIALDLVKQMETVGAAAAILVVVTIISARVEDRIEARLEARAAAADQARADAEELEQTHCEWPGEECPEPGLERVVDRRLCAEHFFRYTGHQYPIAVDE